MTHWKRTDRKKFPREERNKLRRHLHALLIHHFRYNGGANAWRAFFTEKYLKEVWRGPRRRMRAYSAFPTSITSYRSRLNKKKFRRDMDRETRNIVNEYYYDLYLDEQEEIQAEIDAERWFEEMMNDVPSYYDEWIGEFDNYDL